MKNNKSFIRSDNEKQDILKFIERFPKDATTWDKATEELPEIHKTLAYLFVKFAKEAHYDETNYDQKKYWKSKSKTPSEWNTRHRDGIEILLDVLNEQHVKEVHDRYKDWF